MKERAHINAMYRPLFRWTLTYYDKLLESFIPPDKNPT